MPPLLPLLLLLVWVPARATRVPAARAPGPRGSAADGDFRQPAWWSWDAAAAAADVDAAADNAVPAAASSPPPPPPPHHHHDLPALDPGAHRARHLPLHRRLSGGASCEGSHTVAGPTTASGVPFGVGGDGTTVYANSQSCTFTVTCATCTGTATTHAVGVAFTFFHTERNQDVVKIYNADDDAASALPLEDYSGDIPTPFVFSRRGVKNLRIVFEADEALHQSSRTMQLGWTVGAVFDARVGCYNPGTACNGHGSCDPLGDTSAGLGRCNCDGDPLSETDTWWLGDACTLEVRHLESAGADETSKTATVSDLGIDKWAYFWVELDPANLYLLDFQDTGHPNSDPLLTLGKTFSSSSANGGANQPIVPALNADTRTAEDYLSWFCTSLYVVCCVAPDCCNTTHPSSLSLSRSPSSTL